MIPTLFLAAAIVPQEGAAQASLDAPNLMIQGNPYVVEVRIEAPADRSITLPSTVIGAGAFQLDGVALGETEGATAISLLPGQVVETTIDLAPVIAECEGFKKREFQLQYVGLSGVDPVEVFFLRRAEPGIDFMQLPVEQLGDYDVVLQTMYGPMWVQLWADITPHHARNFLDLAYRGFYDENHFHRVIPGFMVQGGGARPANPAPRRVKNEFNDRRHVAGVLSMARLGADTKDADGNLIPQYDSATCEFFIVHKTSPHLDGKYTAFGKIVLGLDALERIVDSVKEGFNPRDPRTHRPKVRQEIKRALVVRAPDRRPTGEDK